MKLKLLLPVTVGLFTLGLISACSSSRSVGGGGRYCVANQADAFATHPTASKVSLKPEDKKIELGNYKYNGGEMLYVYKPVETDQTTWVIIQVTEAVDVQLDKAGTTGTSAGVFCVRGLSPSTPAFSFTTSGVNQMKSLPGERVSVEARTYSFSWSPDTQRITVKADKNSASFATPEKVYEGKATSLNFYKVDVNNVNDFRYEIDAIETYPKQNLTVYLRTKMVRTDLTAAEKVLPSIEEPLTENGEPLEPTPSAESEEEVPAAPQATAEEPVAAE